MRCFKGSNIGLTPHQRRALERRGLLQHYKRWTTWWKSARWPPGTTDDVGGLCPPLVDTAMAGSLSSFFSRGGSMTDEQRQTFEHALKDLRSLTAALDGPARDHFAGLQRVADDVERHLEGIDEPRRSPLL